MNFATISLKHFSMPTYWQGSDRFVNSCPAIEPDAGVSV